MKSIVTPFLEDIKKYCKENEYSIEKLLEFPRCGDEELLIFQNPQNQTGEGLKNHHPAEIVLKITKTSLGVAFEKGKNIDKYLK